jgi:hypothetical protein
MSATVLPFHREVHRGGEMVVTSTASGLDTSTRTDVITTNQFDLVEDRSRGFYQLDQSTQKGKATVVTTVSDLSDGRVVIDTLETSRMVTDTLFVMKSSASRREVSRDEQTLQRSSQLIQWVESGHHYSHEVIQSYGTYTATMTTNITEGRAWLRGTYVATYSFTEVIVIDTVDDYAVSKGQSTYTTKNTTKETSSEGNGFLHSIDIVSTGAGIVNYSIRKDVGYSVNYGTTTYVEATVSVTRDTAPSKSFVQVKEDTVTTGKFWNIAVSNLWTGVTDYYFGFIDRPHRVGLRETTLQSGRETKVSYQGIDQLLA